MSYGEKIGENNAGKGEEYVECYRVKWSNHGGSHWGGDVSSGQIR